MDMDISMDIHAKSVDMHMDMDGCIRISTATLEDSLLAEKCI